MSKPFNIERMDAHDMGVIKVLLLQLMRGNWFGAGSEVVKSEMRLRRTYDPGILVKGLQGFGVNRGLTPVYLRRIIETARRSMALEIPTERLEGVPVYFVDRLLEWYDQQALTRQEFIQILFYRQLHFHNRHEEGMEIFKVKTEDHLNTLKRLAYQCEPFMLLV